MTEDPPAIPLEDLLRIARQHTTHRVEAHREFDDGEAMYAVEVFDLPENDWQPECGRVSDAILDYCQEHDWLASYAVIPARPRAPQSGASQSAGD